MNCHINCLVEAICADTLLSDLIIIIIIFLPFRWENPPEHHRNLKMNTSDFNQEKYTPRLNFIVTQIPKQVNKLVQ